MLYKKSARDTSIDAKIRNTDAKSEANGGVLTDAKTEANGGVLTDAKIISAPHRLSGTRKNASPSVHIEYLYLDLSTCDRCIATDQLLEEVVEVLRPSLTLAGYRIKYKKEEIASEEIAAKYGFLASPTIRVNGKDICGALEENACGCCSDISGTDVTCRTFRFRGKSYSTPPKEMIADGILRAVFGSLSTENMTAEDASDDSPYELPENLRTFFAGKKSKAETANVE